MCKTIKQQITKEQLQAIKKTKIDKATTQEIINKDAKQNRNTALRK